MRRAAALLVLLAAACAPSEAMDSDAEASESDLIGGAPAKTGQFPSTLWIYDGCTAAKVGERYILTAAHCLDGGPRPIILVTNDVGAKGDTLRDLRVVATHIHPSYRPLHTLAGSDAVSDVAVLEIDAESASRLSDVPSAIIDVSPLAEDAPVVIGGYGCEAHDAGPTSSRRLKFHRTKVATSDVRDEQFAARKRPSAFFTHGDALGCPGDSGGPVYLDDGTFCDVIGVNSQLTPDRLATAHARLDVDSRFDVGSWLRSIAGVTVQGSTSDHFATCADAKMLACGAIGAAWNAARSEIGAPIDLPRWTDGEGGARAWQQDFRTKRLREESGRVVVLDRAEARCREGSLTSCGQEFGDDPRVLYECAGGTLKKTACAGSCGLSMNEGNLVLGCMP